MSPENTENTGNPTGGGGYGEPTPEQELGGQRSVDQSGGDANAGGHANTGPTATEGHGDAGENPAAEYGQRADADERAAEERDPKTDPAAPPPAEPTD